MLLHTLQYHFFVLLAYFTQAAWNHLLHPSQHTIFEPSSGILHIQCTSNISVFKILDLRLRHCTEGNSFSCLVSKIYCRWDCKSSFLNTVMHESLPWAKHVNMAIALSPQSVAPDCLPTSMIFTQKVFLSVFNNCAIPYGAKFWQGKILTNLTNFYQFVNIFPIKFFHW